MAEAGTPSRDANTGKTAIFEAFYHNNIGTSKCHFRIFPLAYYQWESTPLTSGLAQAMSSPGGHKQLFGDTDLPTSGLAPALSPSGMHDQPHRKILCYPVGPQSPREAQPHGQLGQGPVLLTSMPIKFTLPQEKRVLSFMFPGLLPPYRPPILLSIHSIYLATSSQKLSGTVGYLNRPSNIFKICQTWVFSSIA